MIQLFCHLLSLCIHAGLLVPGIASANAAAGADTRVVTFDLQDQVRVGVAATLTVELHRGYALTYDDLASDALLVPRGGAAVSQKVTNQANHIFGKKNLAKHRLGGVLDAFGGDQVTALRSIESGAQKLADSGAASLGATQSGAGATQSGAACFQQFRAIQAQFGRQLDVQRLGRSWASHGATRVVGEEGLFSTIYGPCTTAMVTKVCPASSPAGGFVFSGLRSYHYGSGRLSAANIDQWCRPLWNATVERHCGTPLWNATVERHCGTPLWKSADLAAAAPVVTNTEHCRGDRPVALPCVRHGYTP